ncbi:MAG: hypothetical protein LLG01_10630 [Planctomycetaceae bacterium]|nr:hypothetical protein [Planctomycetaceae bacterium]
MIIYTCRGCGEELESPVSLIGQLEPCPICRRKNRVPSPEELAAEDARCKEKAREEEERHRRPAKLDSGFVPHEIPCLLVAGIMDEGKQRLVKKCREKQPILLVRKNRRVVHVCARMGIFNRVKELGYVPERYAAPISKLMDKGWVAEAEIFSVISGVGLNGIGKRYTLRIRGQMKPPQWEGE